MNARTEEPHSHITGTGREEDDVEMNGQSVHKVNYN